MVVVWHGFLWWCEAYWLKAAAADPVCPGHQFTMVSWMVWSRPSRRRRIGVFIARSSIHALFTFAWPGETAPGERRAMFYFYRRLLLSEQVRPARARQRRLRAQCAPDPDGCRPLPCLRADEVCFHCFSFSVRALSEKHVVCRFSRLLFKDKIIPAALLLVLFYCYYCLIDG